MDFINEHSKTQLHKYLTTMIKRICGRFYNDTLKTEETSIITINIDKDSFIGGIDNFMDEEFSKIKSLLDDSGVEYSISQTKDYITVYR
jgi:hypothetical protein